MSEELQKQVKDLTEQNQNLNNQIQQSQAGVDGLLSQLDAHREQINEAITTGLNVRANMMHLKKANNRAVNEISELKKHVDALNQQLEQANKRIAELEAPAA